MVPANSDGVRAIIRAVPWDPGRMQNALTLARQIRAEVVWDRAHECYATFRDGLRAAGDDPAIHLEDDVLPTRDWRVKAEAAISERPDDVIQFFSMRKADREVGSRYEPGRTFMMTQCFYLPAGVSRELAEYAWSWSGRAEHPGGYDMAVAAFLSERRMRYWISVPSLVQHMPWKSVISTRHDRGHRQSKTFTA